MIQRATSVVAINAAAMTADILGIQIYTRNYSTGSFHFVWSAGASPVGVCKVQASNDDVGPTNWVDLSGTGAVSGNTGNGMLELPVFDYKWLRAYYVFTSGSGTLTCRAELRG